MRLKPAIAAAARPTDKTIVVIGNKAFTTRMRSPMGSFASIPRSSPKTGPQKLASTTPLERLGGRPLRRGCTHWLIEVHCGQNQ
jgi:hypothetical protein